jgi:hypothetical protein
MTSNKMMDKNFANGASALFKGGMWGSVMDIMLMKLAILVEQL